MASTRRGDKNTFTSEAGSRAAVNYGDLKSERPERLVGGGVELVVGNGGCKVGRRRGEHLPAVMVHSLSLWPLSSLEMQDAERKREGKGGG